MAADESATVFLETSLGTRFVISFPARDTTVADLKRRVSAEHAACFPHSGLIAVTSLQAKYDGSWFHLTDSMAVEAAFRWVQGPWHLLVEAHELPFHPLARNDAKCRTGDTEQNARRPATEDSTKNMSLPAASQAGGNPALGDGDNDTPQMKQKDKPHEGV
ncbi:uncharacterized protein LOC133886938 [Phragmites australis]|uniref:uncharacterized protein LOC133886938 n=1 Tax=Phragmites australis TaxID=29695 RepID=UPI002D779AB2|nr:uncharacterized protein LOC133886938 [Phragmites australis]